MVVEGGRRPVETLAHAAVSVAAAGRRRRAWGDAGRGGTRADGVVLRLPDDEGLLEARASAPAGSALGAELAGTRVDVAAVCREAVPPHVARVAERSRALGVLAVPA